MDNKIILAEKPYICLQGEGKYIGVPYLLVRMTGCLLACCWCDTPYSSIKPEKVEISKEELIKFTDDNARINHVMITGGEPTTNPNLLNDLCMYFHTQGFHITIETAGTNYVETIADFISISPKFENSIPSRLLSVKEMKHRDIILSEEYKVNICNLIKYHLSWGNDFQIKPVIEKFSDFVELENLLDYLRSRGLNTFGKIYCMPLGQTREELKEISTWLAEQCIVRGYNYTDRLHVRLYNDKRGV